MIYNLNLYEINIENKLETNFRIAEYYTKDKFWTNRGLSKLTMVFILLWIPLFLNFLYKVSYTFPYQKLVPLIHLFMIQGLIPLLFLLVQVLKLYMSEIMICIDSFFRMLNLRQLQFRLDIVYVYLPFVNKKEIQISPWS